MYQDVNTVFQYFAKHQDLNNPKGLVLKHITRCDTAVQARITYPPSQQDIAHILQEDKPDKDYPKCRGETPPETP